MRGGVPPIRSKCEFQEERGKLMSVANSPGTHCGGTREHILGTPKQKHVRGSLKTEDSGNTPQASAKTRCGDPPKDAAGHYRNMLRAPSSRAVGTLQRRCGCFQIRCWYLNCAYLEKRRETCSGLAKIRKKNCKNTLEGADQHFSSLPRGLCEYPLRTRRCGGRGRGGGKHCVCLGRIAPGHT